MFLVLEKRVSFLPLKYLFAILKFMLDKFCDSMCFGSIFIIYNAATYTTKKRNLMTKIKMTLTSEILSLS